MPKPAAPKATPPTSSDNPAFAESQPDELDLLADTMAGDWERVTSPVIDPIIKLANECQDFAEFNRRLPEEIDKLDTSVITELLTQGQFVANVWGRANPNAD